jgi:hypothetical protein
MTGLFSFDGSYNLKLNEGSNDGSILSLVSRGVLVTYGGWRRAHKVAYVAAG